MRRPACFFVFLLSVAVSSSLFADGNVLTKYWKEQRSLPQAQTMRDVVAARSGRTKALVGMEFGTVSRELLAKAEPDECFTAVGGPSGAPPCSGDSQPKVNGGYVWGMVDVGDDVWFGTVANPQCFVAATMIGQALGTTLGPIKTDSWVCEFGGDTWDPLGDQRPPKLYAYHSAAGTLEDLTSGMPPADLEELAKVIGIRAAGSSDGVVLFAGPTIDGDVHMFAFATNGSFLGSHEFADWTDTRRFAHLNGELYLGIGVGSIEGNPPGGMVMRWIGSAASPFDFEMVTYLVGETVAEITEHQGRLAAGTWAVPQVLGPLGGSSGVYLSPDPGADGILSAADGDWDKIWEVADYEPDRINALVTGIGAMASYGGYLYWGTMHPPFLALAAHYGFYRDFYDDINTTDASEEFLLAAALGTHRATSLWLADNLPGDPDIFMLYGLPALPSFDPGTDPIPSDPIVDDYWSIVDTGWEPVWGISGFGNLFNNYTWSMTVNNGRLWVGTMDMQYLLMDAGATMLHSILDSQNMTLEEAIEELVTSGNLDPMVAEILAALGDDDVLTTAGADLYYFPFPDAPAFPESLSGIDNFTSYGVRNMRSVNGKVYAGMANPMNLLTDTSDDVPEGGWELIRLEDKAPNTPAQPQSTVVLEDGSRVTLCDVEDPGYTVGMWLPLSTLPTLVPPPPGMLPATRIMLVGTSANAGPCEGDTLAQVCLESQTNGARLHQLQLIDDPDLGPTPAWVDITNHTEGDFVCGNITEEAQPLLWQLGYNGYLGLVTLLDRQKEPGIPDADPLGRALLILLIAAVGAIVIRLRMS